MVPSKRQPTHNLHIPRQQLRRELLVYSCEKRHAYIGLFCVNRALLRNLCTCIYSALLQIMHTGLFLLRNVYTGLFCGIYTQGSFAEYTHMALSIAYNIYRALLRNIYPHPQHPTRWFWRFSFFFLGIVTATAHGSAGIYMTHSHVWRIYVIMSLLYVCTLCVYSMCVPLPGTAGIYTFEESACLFLFTRNRQQSQSSLRKRDVHIHGSFAEFIRKSPVYAHFFSLSPFLR